MINSFQRSFVFGLCIYMLVHLCSIATTSGGTSRKYGKWTSAEEMSFAALVWKVCLQCFLWTTSIQHLEKIQFKVGLSAVDETLTDIYTHIVSKKLCIAEVSWAVNVCFFWVYFHRMDRTCHQWSSSDSIRARHTLLSLIQYTADHFCKL